MKAVYCQSILNRIESIENRKWREMAKLTHATSIHLFFSNSQQFFVLDNNG